jgi:hypothetical protein
MGYLTGGLGFALFLALGALYISDGRLDTARESLATARVNAQTATEANGTLVDTLAACKNINSENAAQRGEAAVKAAAAEARIIELETKLDTGVEIEKTDNTCRELDVPLPDSFTSQLCIDGAKNCSQD